MSIKILEHPNIFEIRIDWDYFAKRNVESIKAIPGARYNPLRKTWTTPLSSRNQTEDLIKSCKATMSKVQALKPEFVGIADPLPELTIETGLKETAKLRPYQSQGVAGNIKFQRCINGDDPGLGKTIQTIATLSALKCFPAVIVCPATLKLNWAAEIKKFSTIRAMILDDKVKKTWHRYYETGLIDVFIVNYESLGKYFVKSMPEKYKLRRSDQIELVDCWGLVKCVVMDESHRLKNPSAIQTKIALRLAQGKDYRFLLTGTPVVNKPIDLFPQLAILGHLDTFGGKKGFVDRYCDGGTGANNLKELNYLMNQHCYFRRQKQDVLKDLPDKVRQTITCEISTRREYDFAYHEFKSWLASTGCDDREIAKKLRGEILVKMNALRSISAKGKIAAVKDHIDELIESGQKVVVFANLHEIIDQVKNLYPNTSVEISGSISQSKRDENVRKFQNDADCKIIVCNIRAGGVGLTLTASSNVIFIEYPWTWADCMQCEDRTHRIGQKESVTAAYFFGQNTIDQRLFEIIQEKKDVSDAITGNTDVVEMQMIDKVLSLFEN